MVYNRLEIKNDIAKERRCDFAMTLSIQLVDCRRDGDYLVFSGPGSGNLIILEPLRIHAIWIGAVGILVIIWFLWKKESKQNKVKE